MLALETSAFGRAGFESRSVHQTCEWWNGIHMRLKTSRLRDCRVRIPPHIPNAPIAQRKRQRFQTPYRLGSNPSGSTKNRVKCYGRMGGLDPLSLGSIPSTLTSRYRLTRRTSAFLAENRGSTPRSDAKKKRG